MPSLLCGRPALFLPRAVGAVAVVVVLSGLASAQTPRSYNVNRTTTAPVADGVVSPGEWTAAATASGSWGVLREGATDMDTENNRFRMMWDDTNLYILYETDFNQFTTDAVIEDPRPNVTFAGPDILNFYLDPNEDDEPNDIGTPDGYQLAFHQYKGPGGVATISTNADRQGIGFYTEAHVDNTNGDQGKWNKDGSDVQGGGLQDIVVGQTNGAAGGVAEVVWPWANFNALEFTGGASVETDFDSDGLTDGNDFLIWQRNLGPATVTDKSTGDANLDGNIDGADLELWKGAYGTNTQVATGLNATEGPTAGDVWFLQVGRQNGLGNVGNFLPIWNWQPSQSFTTRPHGTITFVGAGAGGVPEPAAVSLAVMSLIALGGLRRRGA